jgi:aminoglycoside phosphotransferase (APT) family kinase protein
MSVLPDDVHNFTEAVVDVPALTRWLATQQLPTEVSDLQVLKGGSQNVVVALSLDGRRVVLRRPPVHPREYSNRTIEREMRVLAALAGTAVPHPRFLAGSADPAVLGGAFYLMERVDGFNPGEELPAVYAADPALVAQAAFSFVDELAALGRLDPDALGLADFGRPATFLDRQIDRQVDLQTELEQVPGYSWRPAEDFRALASWLRGTRPVTVPGLAHGDYTLGNVLLHRDRPAVAAVLDWELCTVGDPLLDLGWMLLSLPGPDGGAVSPSGTLLTAAPGFPSRERMVERYRCASGRSVAEIDWYAALAAFKICTMAGSTYVRSTQGKVPTSLGRYCRRLSLAAADLAVGIGLGSVSILDRS